MIHIFTGFYLFVYSFICFHCRKININHTVWIGLNDKVEEGTYKWIDNTEANSSEIFWSKPREPNNAWSGFSDQDCVMLEKNNYAYDDQCDRGHAVLCEKPSPCNAN